MGKMEVDKFIEQLKRDFPGFWIREGKRFKYRFPRSIQYERPRGGKMNTEFGLQVLHELGHAMLEHKNFKTDPERLKMEWAAWEEARKMCSRYNIIYDEELVEAKMDTYRDWLHRRSKCRKCGLTRYQTMDGEYHCPNCEAC